MSEPNLKKRKRGKCLYKDDTEKYKNGCNSRQCYREGGEKGRCTKHGGHPFCNYKDDTEKYKNGCKTTQQFREGGKKGRCLSHGGAPFCNYKDDTEKYKNGCKTTQQFREGGEKGRCRVHGGTPLCNYKDDTEKYKNGCQFKQYYREGGEKGKCLKHGGTPFCNYKDDTEQYKNGCTSKQTYTEGGEKGRCASHGGVPFCNYKDYTEKYKNGCNSRQCYREGGEKGRCLKHGGSPFCNYKDDTEKYKNGCQTRKYYEKGGEKGRCTIHGGVPILKCDYLDSSLLKKQDVFGELVCGHIVKGKCNLQEHITNNHTLKSHDKKRRVELQWLDFLKEKGYGVDNDQKARVNHCSNSNSKSSSTFLPLDKTPLYSSRIDFFMTSLAVRYPKYLLFIEIDENYHRDRCLASEFARMQENLTSLGLQGNYKDRSHVVIRLNPDAFKINNVKQHVSRSERQAQLVKVLETDWSDHLLEGTNVNIIYMYYPTSEQLVLKETLSASLLSHTTALSLSGKKEEEENTNDSVKVKLPTLFSSESDQLDYDMSKADIDNALIFRKCILRVF